MDTGDMRRIILIQQNTGTRSSAGQKLEVWTDIPKRPQMFSSFSEQRGGDPTIADTKAPVKRGRWKVHYREDLDETMTILFKGRRWEINAIQEISPRQGLFLHATWTKGQYEN